MTDITTPIGRFVAGDAFRGSSVGMNGQPRVDKNGQPRLEWFMAIAIQKNDPGWPALKSAIDTAAAAAWPNGESTRPGFSNKIVDGDGLDRQGVPNANREGYAGCWVLRMTTGIQPKMYDESVQEIIDPMQLQRGYYIRASIGIAGNNSTQTPGVYVNLKMCQRMRVGEIIETGPDPQAAFGTAIATPAPVQPAAPVAPAHDFLAGPPVRQMSSTANYTYEQYIAAGWDDAKLIAAGHMLPPVAPAADDIPF